MKTSFAFLFKALRKLYAKASGSHILMPLPRETDPDKASDMIYELLHRVCSSSKLLGCKFTASLCMEVHSRGTT